MLLRWNLKPDIDESALQANCICSTQLDFYIEVDEAFRNATILVFDYGWDPNPSNKMHIVKQRHVIEIYAKQVYIQCWACDNGVKCE